jgi:hypothetical protein
MLFLGSSPFAVEGTSLYVDPQWCLPSNTLKASLDAREMRTALRPSDVETRSKQMFVPVIETKLFCLYFVGYDFNLEGAYFFRARFGQL